jgi:hypothetical protein
MKCKNTVGKPSLAVLISRLRIYKKVTIPLQTLLPAVSTCAPSRSAISNPAH